MNLKNAKEVVQLQNIIIFDKFIPIQSNLIVTEELWSIVQNYGCMKESKFEKLFGFHQHVFSK